MCFLFLGPNSVYESCYLDQFPELGSLFFWLYVIGLSPSTHLLLTAKSVGLCPGMFFIQEIIKTSELDSFYGWFSAISVIYLL